MFEKTRGIVLLTIPYNDRTQFLHVYTERYGMATYRIKTPTGRRRATERLMQAPMTVLEMEVEHSPRVQIQNLREAHILTSPYEASMADPGKMGQCMFLAELLDKCIVEVEPNAELFGFVLRSVELLAMTEGGCANFHLAFTMRLCHLLGFQIDTTEYEEGMIFDLREGIFTRTPLPHSRCLDPATSQTFAHLLRLSFAELVALPLSREQRNYWTDTLLAFLREHLPEMGEVKSLEVLKVLFA